VLVQRYNAILLHDALPAPDCTHWWPAPSCAYSFKHPLEHIYSWLITTTIIIIIIIMSPTALWRRRLAIPRPGKHWWRWKTSLGFCCTHGVMVTAKWINS